jgi:hypothetical protein
MTVCLDLSAYVRSRLEHCPLISLAPQTVKSAGTWIWVGCQPRSLQDLMRGTGRARLVVVVGPAVLGRFVVVGPAVARLVVVVGPAVVGRFVVVGPAVVGRFVVVILFGDFVALVVMIVLSLVKHHTLAAALHSNIDGVKGEGGTERQKQRDRERERS